MKMMKSKGGTISDLSPALQVLVQAVTLGGYRDGSYHAVMPDLIGENLRGLQDVLNGPGFRKYYYNRRNQPLITSDLARYFANLFDEFFAEDKRIPATAECWMSDKQVPYETSKIIRGLGFSGRHGEHNDTAGWLSLEMTLLTASYKTAHAHVNTIADAFLRGPEGRLCGVAACRTEAQIRKRGLRVPQHGPDGKLIDSRDPSIFRLVTVPAGFTGNQEPLSFYVTYFFRSAQSHTASGVQLALTSILTLHKGNIRDFLIDNPYVQMIHCTHEDYWDAIYESNGLKPGCEADIGKNNVKNAIMFSCLPACLGNDISGANFFERLHFFLNLEQWCSDTHNGFVYIQSTYCAQVVTKVPLSVLKCLHTHKWCDMQNPTRQLTPHEREYLRLTNQAQRRKDHRWDVNLNQHNAWNPQIPIADVSNILSFAMKQAKPLLKAVKDRVLGTRQEEESQPAPKRMPRSLKTLTQPKQEQPDKPMAEASGQATMDTSRGSLDPAPKLQSKAKPLPAPPTRPTPGSPKDTGINVRAEVARIEGRLPQAGISTVWDSVDQTAPTEVQVRRLTDYQALDKENQKKRTRFVPTNELKMQDQTNNEILDNANSSIAIMLSMRRDDPVSFETEVAKGSDSFHLLKITTGTVLRMDTLLRSLGFYRHVSFMKNYDKDYKDITITHFIRFVVFDMLWKTTWAKNKDLQGRPPQVHSTVTEERAKLMRCGLTSHQVNTLFIWVEHLLEALDKHKAEALPDFKDWQNEVDAAWEQAQKTEPETDVEEGVDVPETSSGPIRKPERKKAKTKT